jgi:hypothetical protein
MNGSLRVGIGIGVGSATMMFGLVGLLHMPALRPLLNAGSGGCPIGMDESLTVAQIDAARQTALLGERGDRPADARPALGFVLDVTSSDEVAAWAAAHGVSCTPERAEIRCGDVPGGALEGLPATDELLLRFDADGRLVSVDATLRDVDADDAAALVRTLSDALGRSAGPPSAARGEPSGRFLARGDLNQTATSFRFADYRADLSATNLGAGRIVFRASFQSVG